MGGVWTDREEDRVKRHVTDTPTMKHRHYHAERYAVNLHQARGTRHQQRHVASPRSPGWRDFSSLSHALSYVLSSCVSVLPRTTGLAQESTETLYRYWRKRTLRYRIILTITFCLEIAIAVCCEHVMNL